MILKLTSFGWLPELSCCYQITQTHKTENPNSVTEDEEENDIREGA